jgi:hypothetical protein
MICTEIYINGEHELGIERKEKNKPHEIEFDLHVSPESNRTLSYNQSGIP